MSDPSIDEIMAEVGFEMAMDKSDEADRLRAKVERLEADNKDMRRTLDAPIPWLLERELRAEIERLQAALSDCVALLRGDIQGGAQRTGIIREAEAALAGKEG